MAPSNGTTESISNKPTGLSLSLSFSDCKALPMSFAYAISLSLFPRPFLSVTQQPYSYEPSLKRYPLVAHRHKLEPTFMSHNGLFLACKPANSPTLMVTQLLLKPLLVVVIVTAASCLAPWLLASLLTTTALGCATVDSQFKVDMDRCWTN